MYIHAVSETGEEFYINTVHVQKFQVGPSSVTLWHPDNLCVELKKTKELKDQLDALCQGKTTKGFEKFS